VSTRPGDADLADRAPGARGARTVNVDEVLDALRFRGLPLVVAVCVGVVLVLDGFDIQLIGFAAPALLTDLGVERGALAPALAASLVGMAVGATGIGAVGDRWGRRPALLLSTLLFGLATLLGATASSVAALTVWRFATGLGLGGALPTATALMAEFSPPRVRSRALGAAIVGVPVGGIVGALVAAEILPALGWRALFVVGGVLPLAAALAMYFVLPESPRYLATRPDGRGTLASLLNRLTASARYSARDAFVLREGPAPAHAAGVRALFAPELRWDTVMTSLVFLTNVFAVFAFFNWAPLVLTSMGHALETAVRGLLVFNAAGVVGALLGGWSIARLGSRATLAAFALTAVFSLAWLTWAALATGAEARLPEVMAGFAVAGFAINAVQVGMYAVAAHVFPTPCRSSGVGWALGWGRLGGILSAFASGGLLAQAAAPGFFGGIACVLVLTFATLLLVRRHIEPSLQSA
jgi:AAHS family 4-hydroxybenzoate transporter-like MFS transporter